MTERAIQFQHGNACLAGILVVPSGEGPHPAVVFIHGSGPENRDGGGLYRLLWKHFAQQGFACLSWDKPGVGESTGDWTRQDYGDRAQEGLAALHFLQAQKDIDPSRIGLWGLSEGGLVSALAATLDEDVAFVISVSSPAGSFVERELFRTEAQMRAEKATEDAVRSACRVTSREMELIRGGASIEELNAVAKAVENEPWFAVFEYINSGGGWTPGVYARVRRHMEFDAESVLERVKCPVLGIWGEFDCTVSAERSCEVFRRCLARSGNRDVTLKVFPRADHGLFPTVTGGMREMLQSWKEQKGFVPNYLETMTGWLKAKMSAS